VRNQCESKKRELCKSRFQLENTEKAQIKLVTDIICTGALDGWGVHLV